MFEVDVTAFTLIATFCAIAFSSQSPGKPRAACTAGVTALTIP